MTYDELRQIVAKYQDLCKCPELKVSNFKTIKNLKTNFSKKIIVFLQENPFRKRICKVFSEDDSGNLTFDQFVNLFSVFSDRAPREMKVQFAFKIFGNQKKIFSFSK